jgi:hypothetical protein
MLSHTWATKDPLKAADTRYSELSSLLAMTATLTLGVTGKKPDSNFPRCSTRWYLLRPDPKMGGSVARA